MTPAEIAVRRAAPPPVRAMRPKAGVKAKQLEWMTTGSVYAVVRSADRVLVVGATQAGPDRWLPLAFETKNARPVDAAAVFADHSHAILGEPCPLAQAKQLAVRFARKWLAGGAPGTPCPCETIGAKLSSSRRPTITKSAKTPSSSRSRIARKGRLSKARGGERGVA